MITARQNSAESLRSCDSRSDWQTTTVGLIAEVKGGKRLPKGDKFSASLTGFPYIRVTDFENFGVRTNDLKYLRPDTRSQIKRYTISVADVYISIAGTIGLTGMIPKELDAANLTENAAKLVLTSADLDPVFLMYFLASEQVQREIRSQTVKNAQPKLALARIASLEIRHPSLAEQHKIAAVLGLVRRAMDEQEHLLSLTCELTRALLQQLFTQGLHRERQKQTDVGLVPRSWCVTRLDDFCILQRGFDIVKKDQVPGDVPVVSSGGIASYHNVAKVKGPGVVVGRKGTLGKVHYIEGDYWPHDTTLWVKDFKVLAPV